jgi:hypothetical protein
VAVPGVVSPSPADSSGMDNVMILGMGGGEENQPAKFK